ncbi:MAG: hypothetical protein ACJAWV_003992 [Flammeovirgaceae bacterium]|jgi:hypothetical protein
MLRNFFFETGLSYKSKFCVRHAKKKVFSLVRVSRTIAKMIEISSFGFYRKALIFEMKFTVYSSFLLEDCS